MTNAQKSQRERYAFYKGAGICVHCGRMWAEPGHVSCKACEDKKRAVRRMNDPDGERHREDTRNRRAYRREHGLCIDCGKPVWEGKQRCAKCLAARRESWQVWKIKQRMEAEAAEARKRGKEQ